MQILQPSYHNNTSGHTCWYYISTSVKISVNNRTQKAVYNLIEISSSTVTALFINRLAVLFVTYAGMVSAHFVRKRSIVYQAEASALWFHLHQMMTDDGKPSQTLSCYDQYTLRTLSFCEHLMFQSISEKKPFKLITVLQPLVNY